MIGISALEGVVTGEIAAAAEKFSDASQRQDTARSDYEKQVTARINDDGVWRDPAKANAQQVLQVMGLSFDTASTNMLAAATTLGTLTAEMAVSKQSLADLKNKAASEKMKIVDDQGKVEPEHVPIVLSPHGGGEVAQADVLGKAAELEALIKATLQRATSADERCGQLLRRVADAKLSISALADPAVLAAAKSENEASYRLLGDAAVLGEELQNNARAKLQEIEDREYTSGEFLLGLVKGFWDGDPVEAAKKGQGGALIGAILSYLPIGRGAKGGKAASRAAVGQEAKNAARTARFEPPKVTRDRHGRATNGTYTVGGQQAKHTSGSTKDGKSQFLYQVDDEKATLDAASFADKHNLWSPDGKAKVYVEDGPVGVLGDGTPTHWINVYRNSNGTVHGSPGSPP